MKELKIQQRITKLIKDHGLDEQGARFVIALADQKINSDIFNDVPLSKKKSLGEVIREEQKLGSAQ